MTFVAYARRYRPRICTCCGQEKAAKEFSYNSKKNTYTSYCLDCGVWLKLFRTVFPESRDWSKNKKNQRSRYNRIMKKNAPIHALMTAWGIQLPQDMRI